MINRPRRKRCGGEGGGGGEGWQGIRVGKVSTVMAKTLNKIGTKGSQIF